MISGRTVANHVGMGYNTREERQANGMENIYTVPQLQAILSPVFSRYGIRRAVLFGSYGKGTATEKSDVDLLVDSGLRGLKFVGFLDEVQRTVGKEVDLFDVSHIQAGSQIEREIKDTGITVYEK